MLLNTISECGISVDVCPCVAIVVLLILLVQYNITLFLFLFEFVLNKKVNVMKYNVIYLYEYYRD